MTFPNLYKRSEVGVAMEHSMGDANWTAIEDAFWTMVPYKISQVNTAVIRTCNNLTDASFVTLASIVVPAGMMGINSTIRIVTDWDFTNALADSSSANTKTLAVDWGTSIVSSPTYANPYLSAKLITEIQNAGSLSNQKTMNLTTHGPGSTAHVSTTKDTATAITIDIKCKWGANNTASSQTITLVGYSIYHFPGD